ncbi:MAG: Asp-tRNA(Asn)/Glu-tRNA(Gln) amidotransferase subunit GatB [Candidatus Marinimicrobia bacterium]|nr:Asp-tRNA(Asn)/Glu-tRNA(Gln) amidotransferase subunit GatB [Candidatus Neomarinimicrobiota bacterium]
MIPGIPGIEPQKLEKWEPVIGLEVHAQLATQTKMFCGCRREYGAAPNTHVCPVCLAYPGALPVINEEAVNLAVRLGLAVGCAVRPFSRFARKNYFYPDLPKGYQISQFDEPICEGGHIDFYLDGGDFKSVRLTRIHMEEDAGKLIHGSGEESYVDFNRSGTPLVEIVSEPDMRTPQEAKAYLDRLKQTLIYTGVSEADMEKGNLRCDANISIRPRGSETLGTRTEMKNLNSFRGVERGLTYEINRQIDLLESGGAVLQASLQWDDAAGVTRVMRIKEEANDYRYFPEPDLVPLMVPAERIDEIRAALPELPSAIEKRYADEYDLKVQDIHVLTRTPQLAQFFEAVIAGGVSPQLAAQWVQGEVLRVLNEERQEIADFAMPPDRLAGLIGLVDSGTINRNTGKAVFDDMLSSGLSAREVVDRDGLAQVSDSDELRLIVRSVVHEMEVELARYKAGEKQLFGHFMGSVMAATRGKGDPRVVRGILQELLNADG